MVSPWKEVYQEGSGIDIILPFMKNLSRGRGCGQLAGGIRRERKA